MCKNTQAHEYHRFYPPFSKRGKLRDLSERLSPKNRHLLQNLQGIFKALLVFGLEVLQMQHLLKEDIFKSRNRDGVLQSVAAYLVSVFLFTSATKKGFSCLEFQRQLGLKRYQKAFSLMHKIRAVKGKRDGLYFLLWSQVATAKFPMLPLSIGIETIVETIVKFPSG